MKVINRVISSLFAFCVIAFCMETGEYAHQLQFDFSDEDLTQYSDGSTFSERGQESDLFSSRRIIDFNRSSKLWL